MKTEEVLVIPDADDSIVAVLHRGNEQNDIGVVVVVGGPQYRVGSHRQFVLLARALAHAGYSVLRFDVRGMGDSRGEARGFEYIDEDIAAAIEALLRQQPQIRRVVLWGLCDGASAALLYCYNRRDPRVAGLCLVNPWVRSAASLARTQVKHYYLQRLRQGEFWLKLLNGKVASSALRNLWRNLSLARLAPTGGHESSFQARMGLAWQRFDGPLLLLLSDNDYTAKEFVEYVSANPGWSGALAHARLTRREVIAADHTVSQPAAREEVERQTIAWLDTAVVHGSHVQRLPAAAVSS